MTPNLRIDNPYLVGKMLKSISPDSVRSGRTCPANLSVRSCPVRKLICPVRSSPRIEGADSKKQFLRWIPQVLKNVFESQENFKTFVL